MHTRPLGSSGLHVCPIGLGTVKLGRLAGLKYPSSQTLSVLPTDEQALELLRAARELGVNLIDTAPAYGRSEERLGALLPQIEPRDHWVLCTKVGESFDGVRSTYDFSAEAIALSIRQSLSRLRTDHVDIALLHFSGSTDDAGILSRGEAIGALREAQRAGLVRAIGASTATLAGAQLAVDVCDVVMVTLNSGEQDCAPAIASARAKQVGVLVKKPLGSGHLDVHASLRSVFIHDGVDCAIIGTSSAANLREAVSVVAGLR